MEVMIDIDWLAGVILNGPGLYPFVQGAHNTSRNISPVLGSAGKIASI
jgi:hypothetical protein